MSPNFGVPPWKRAASRAVFYAAFVCILALFDAESVTGDTVEIDYSTWTNEELGAATPIYGEILD